MWCADNTATYVKVTPGGALDETQVNTTLVHAIMYMIQYIERNGDTAFSGGQFLYANWSELVLAVDPSKSWTLKWSMMRDAVSELLDWMITTSHLGAAQFELYHGPHLVGTGAVRLRQIDV